MPVLFFGYYEDEGFGYVILHNKKPISSFSCYWGHYIEIALLLSREIYGFDEGLERYIEDRIEDRENFNKIVADRQQKYLERVFFKNNSNPDNFRLFDFCSDDISKLKDLLTPKSIKDPYSYDIAKEFKTIINIEYLDFVSWHYATKEQKGT